MVSSWLLACWSPGRALWGVGWASWGTVRIGMVRSWLPACWNPGRAHRGIGWACWGMHGTGWGLVRLLTIICAICRCHVSASILQGSTALSAEQGLAADQDKAVYGLRREAWEVSKGQST